MSSSFDTMQHAVLWLEERIGPDDAQAQDVLFYLKEAIDVLHDYSHRTNDAPNRAAGSRADLLRTALRHENDEDRQLWLDAKDNRA